MSKPIAADQLNASIDALLYGSDCAAASDLELRDLLEIAADLQTLPNPDFRLRLRADLMDAAILTRDDTSARDKSSTRLGPEIMRLRPAEMRDDFLPTLLGKGYGVYPAQRASFMVSALAHVAALALLVTVGIFAAHMNAAPRVSSSVVTDIRPYILPAALDRTGGGGGGGDRDKLQASKGSPPRFAFDQVSPPAIVVRNETSKLVADPTVVGPPNLSFPQTRQLGDPSSDNFAYRSNGTGGGGGIGYGLEGGVGPGWGPGLGPGGGGGIGGGPYLVGGGVSVPRAIYDPEPEYSEEARKAKYQGSVVLRVVIGSDGSPRDIHLVRSLGMGLDEKAIAAVQQWRFNPAQKDGQPVAVFVDIEVNFRLY